jgi:quercetin dioxygenase-like cupin family protein
MKFVSKPWGHELWIADGTETPYAVKRIKFNAGNRTSLQVHQLKSETNYVLSGTGILRKSLRPFDVEQFLKIGMTEAIVRYYEDHAMETIQLEPGVVVNIAAGYVHRVLASTDLEFIEISTPELADVIRLQDDTGRSHGKIQSEHQS